MAMFAPPTEVEMGGSQEVPGQFESPWYTEALPTVGGVVGGITGTLAGAGLGGVGAIPGGVAGAGLGEAAGEAYRDIIETQFLGKPQRSGEEVATAVGKAAAIGAGSQLIGEGIVKALGTAAKLIPKESYEPIASWASNMVKNAKAKIEGPALKILAERGTQMNTREAGDAVKTSLRQGIEQKYAPFIESYKAMDDISKSLPIRDEARRDFTQKLKAWALSDLSRDNYKVVAKIADDIDAANNGLQLEDLAMSLSGDASAQYGRLNAPMGKFYSDLAGRIDDFLEVQTEGLAKKVLKGKATPEEMNFFTQIAQQRGIPPEEITKYPKQLANDFLKGKAKIDSDYAGYKAFLEDVGEQTKTKMRKYNTKSLLNRIDEVPSEQLVERMFQEKNSAALLKMKEQSPEVFDIVQKTKMTDIMRRASPEGKLDVKEAWSLLNKMPVSTRRLLVNDDEMSLLLKTGTSPKLRRIEALQKASDGMIANWIKNLYTATELGVEAGAQTVRKSPALQSAAKYGVGTVGQRLVGPYLDEYKLPRTVDGMGE